MSYNNSLDTSFNANVKYYKCQNFGHIVRHCMMRIDEKKKTVIDQKVETKPEHKMTKEEKK